MNEDGGETAEANVSAMNASRGEKGAGGAARRRWVVAKGGGMSEKDRALRLILAEKWQFQIARGRSNFRDSHRISFRHESTRIYTPNPSAYFILYPLSFIL